MKRAVIIIVVVLLAGAAGIAWHYFRPPADAPPVVAFDLDDFRAGEHAVGAITHYSKNLEAPFDEWGARYGGAEYRELVAAIDATGEPRTTVTEIWYPAIGAEGPPATWGDFFRGSERLLASVLTFFEEQAPEGVPAGLAERLASLERGSRIGAPAARGPFPLIVLVHGLGGKRIDWSDAAEALARQGYVVAAVTMTSDGTLPPVFNDPDSRYVAAHGEAAAEAAYDVMQADVKVFPRFLEYLYGIDAPDIGPSSFPDISAGVAPDGGADKMTEMMARLFQQRVDDVAALLRDLEVLAADESECAERYATLGLTGKACGLLAGRIDFANVGIAGHSLGSITTQVALRQVPAIKAGVGLNNGIPKRWEPQSHGIAPAGTAENIEKPMLFVHGTEDDFVYFVFQLLFGDWYEAAGGDRREIFLLPDELAPRTAEHSQPVVFAAYNRAAGPKMAVSVIDGNHDGMDSPRFTRFLQEHGLELPAVARRLPDGEGPLGSLPGPLFRVLGSATDSAGRSFRLPTFIANYYLSAWFGWHLKGDGEALERLRNPPFEAHVKVRREGV